MMLERSARMVQSWSGYEKRRGDEDLGAKIEPGQEFDRGTQQRADCGTNLVACLEDGSKTTLEVSGKSEKSLRSLSVRAFDDLQRQSFQTMTPRA